ncbi:hypothetical protein ABL78_1248 [Leptomonas seymouri]|uniref:Uncharacterized protein n=1 Tax=Leptomonas seymouri TaxID=5684 RepID=A0A0N0P8L2_LEPSE|nr:hypothetical protein ABL78_1248 [Leptomonas seymouri]|eukprot:KPI89667.1 hypothetical protein ABL78_1248 [Leptomonas seymouri]
MSTIPDCSADERRSQLSLNGYATICLEPAANQNTFSYSLPSIASWFSRNWYVIFILVFVAVLSTATIILQVIRWLRRIAHRHEREEKDKRVDGLVRMVSSSFRFAPSS